VDSLQSVSHCYAEPIKYKAALFRENFEQHNFGIAEHFYTRLSVLFIQYSAVVKVENVEVC